MGITQSAGIRVAGILCFVALLSWDSVALASPEYTIDGIGLTGTNYSYTSSGGVSQFSFPWQLNAAGQVIGYSERYSSSGGLLGYDCWFYNGTSTQLIGLTGTNYSFATVGGTYQHSVIRQNNDLTEAGQAAGNSERYSSSGTGLGEDTWFFNGSSTQEIGLTGTIYGYAAAGGIYQESEPQQLNEAGQVMGYSFRYGNSGAYLGSDSWISNGSSTQQIGLTGTNYSYAASGGTYQYSYCDQLNPAGQVIGFSDRFSSSGRNLGYDTWIYNGSSTQQTGLTGANYSYALSGGTYENSQTSQLSAAGQVIGYTDRFSTSGVSLGSDSWIYNGTTTEQIGLTGTNYSYAASGGTFQSSQPQLINAAGQVVGSSNRYSSSGDSLGADAWFFNGSTTQPIGLTGTNYSYAAPGGTFEGSSVQQLNSAGQADGVSYRFSSAGGSLGYDSWCYNGSSTQQIGLTGASYGYATSGGIYQYSFPTQITAAGQVVGYSNRYSSSGGSLGQDDWFYDGVTTQQIGLTGANFGTATSGGTSQNSSVLQVNSAGQVIGTSNADSGQVGWFFDPATDDTVPLEFSVDTATGIDNSYPEVLTDTGAVLGQYDLYSGSVLEGVHMFYWSESNGFSDLGALVSGGLSVQGWQELADVLDAEGFAADGSPLFIVGDGELTDQTTGEQSEYLLSQIVPEPGTGSLLLIAGSGLLFRRRKK